MHQQTISGVVNHDILGCTRNSLFIKQVKLVKLEGVSDKPAATLRFRFHTKYETA